MIQQNAQQPKPQRALFLQGRRTCKPGSVHPASAGLSRHLSRTHVAVRLMPPSLDLRRANAANGKPFALRSGVASDRVYMNGRLPDRQRALISAFPPLPRRSVAVSLCCTCPEVSLGGRYPLSCPAKPGLSSWGQAPRGGTALLVCYIIIHDFSPKVKSFPKKHRQTPAAVIAISAVFCHHK